MKGLKRILPLFAVLLLSAGCATKPEITPENDIPGVEWNLSKAETALGGDDPVEPFNRAMYAVNDGAMRWVVRPVSWVYCSVLPKEVIQRIDNVSDNLAFPGRMTSCLLQAKFKGAGISASRFLINTTVGIVGIFDPAGDWFDLRRRHENMGHAFASWGIGPGCVFILPFSTATNPRDQVGMLFDSLLDLKVVIPYAGYVSSLNRVMNAYDSYNDLTESSPDRYEQFKLSFLALRYTEINDLRFKLKTPVRSEFWNHPHSPRPGDTVVRTESYYHPENPLVDTLRNPMFTMQHNRTSWWTKTSLWNTDFVNLGTERGVRDTPDSDRRYYQFWNLSPKKDGIPRKNELVILIPGVGTHYTGHTVRAFAELFSEAGYGVVSTSSTMNWAFATTPETAFPGYIPDDVAHLRKHLRMILDDLRDNLDYRPTRVIAVGYSLGGLQVLHMAEAESREDTLGISRYVALNPPADLLHALECFEKLSLVSKNWTRSEFFENMGDAVVKYLPAAQKIHPFQPVPNLPVETGKTSPAPQTPEYFYQVRVTPEQAAVMISLSFRMSLRELMISNARNGFLPEKEYPYHWGDRAGLYEKIDSLSGMEYVVRFVKPRHPELSMEQMRYDSSLLSIRNFLRESEKIRVIHNLDDPLITQMDADNLSLMLGKKLVWFDHGAHLGNLHLEAFHGVLLNMVGE